MLGFAHGLACKLYLADERPTQYPLRVDPLTHGEITFVKNGDVNIVTGRNLIVGIGRQLRNIAARVVVVIIAV